MADGFQGVLSPVGCHQPFAFPPSQEKLCLSNLSVPPGLLGEMQVFLSRWIKSGPFIQQAYILGAPTVCWAPGWALGVHGDKWLVLPAPAKPQSVGEAVLMRCTGAQSIF